GREASAGQPRTRPPGDEREALGVGEADGGRHFVGGPREHDDVGAGPQEGQAIRLVDQQLVRLAQNAVRPDDRLEALAKAVPVGRGAGCHGPFLRRACGITAEYSMGGSPLRRPGARSARPARDRRARQPGRRGGPPGPVISRTPRLYVTYAHAHSIRTSKRLRKPIRKTRWTASQATQASVPVRCSRPTWATAA